MKFCNKCGAQLDSDAKFCSVCGNPCDDTEKIDEIIEEDEPVEKQPSSKKTLKIILICVAVLVVLGIVGGVFYKISLMKKNVENSRKIQITSIKVDNYPQVEIDFKADNFQDELTEDKISVKENETYAKDLKLSKVKNNEYTISYKSAENTYDSKNVTVAYDDNGTEKTAKADYTPKEKSDTAAKSQDAGNSGIIETHDSNEYDVNCAINDYEDAFVKMVNYKDTYYIRSSIDLSGNLINDFASLVEKYENQEITEDLLDHNVEGMTKINDSQYEVTVHERFDIYYGVEECEKVIEYRTIYVVNNTNEGFKVGAIKNINQLSCRTV